MNQACINTSSLKHDIILCYEELRSNVLQDPFYLSQSKNLFQNRGMLLWLKNVEKLNMDLTYQKEEINTDILTNFSISNNAGIRKNGLSNLLAGIIINIYPEVLYV